jgi:large subunit ribosomal protein L9
VKVVFLETVEGSGTMGEVLDVANGYARNFLLPRGFAAPATPELLQRVEELTAIEEERQRDEDGQAHELVGKLEGHPLVMAVRVGEQGRLYGSVTNNDIAEKAGEILGEGLDRRRVLLPEVIRSVGVYTVPLRLSRNVTAEAQVVVVDAEAPEGAEAAAEAMLAQPSEAELAAEAVAAVAAMETDHAEDTDGVSELGEETSADPADADPGTADQADGPSASASAENESPPS